MMRKVSHKSENLMNLESVYESDNSIYVVMELLKGKTLYDTIKEVYPLLYRKKELFLKKK